MFRKIQKYIIEWKWDNDFYRSRELYKYGPKKQLRGFPDMDICEYKLLAVNAKKKTDSDLY